MKKLNLLKISLMVTGVILFSCSKEVQITEDDYSATATEIEADVKCWDLNDNGEPDEDEDVNKDGKVDEKDCDKK